MSFPEKPDWRGAYLEMAKTARLRADACPDPEFRKTWNRIADDWEYLALFHGERCACGCPAIGAKRLEGGQRVPYCAKHVNMEIVNDMLTRTGLIDPN
ncbi:MAG: hypothetical protein JO256_12950 [Alphaproteobacteria bacterium]|nr:hypothetical protein [Alphaproteobacteria bacterium]